MNLRDSRDPGPPGPDIEDPVVQVVEVTKEYPGVVALADVTVDFLAGEIHAVVGENGAGKSTLVRLLAGLIRADTGELVVDGRPVHFRDPRDARNGGISVVPQEPQGVPAFNVGRTVTLGLEGFWSRRSRLGDDDRQVVRGALDKVGAERLDDARLVSAISVAELRLCQIARTLLDPGRLIVLDEPTAVLAESDAEALLTRLETLRGEGRSIVYISHRLGEVLRIADRVSVLRDGRLVGTFTPDDLDRDRLVTLMARTEANGTRAATPRRPAQSTGDRVLQVNGLTRSGSFNNVDLEVRAGEIIGIAGVQGSGHAAVLDAIAGAVGTDSGTVTVDDISLPGGHLAEAYSAGIRLVPEDRRRRGIVGCRPVRENLSLAGGPTLHRFGLRRLAAERTLTQRTIAEFDVRTPSTETLVERLSGGNQQKIVLGRVLASDPRVLLLCEPTQGIDVRSKGEIRQIITELARERGLGIVLASSEFEELIDHADRIYVMCEGTTTRTFDAGTASYRDVLAAALP